MSNTARKARKRAGITFVHPTKTVTPVTERAENRPGSIFGNPLTHKPTRYGVTAKAKRRLEARLPQKNGRPVVAETEPIQELEEDPKPYRVGRKRYSIYDVLNGFHQEDGMAEAPDAIFAPRKQYEQDSVAYGIKAPF